jgi:hypothetical protein
MMLSVAILGQLSEGTIDGLPLHFRTLNLCSLISALLLRKKEHCLLWMTAVAEKSDWVMASLIRVFVVKGDVNGQLSPASVAGFRPL